MWVRLASAAQSRIKVSASGGPDEMKRLLGANDSSRTQVTQRC